MRRDPSRDEYAICTAVTPSLVFTVRMYRDPTPYYGPGLVRNLSGQQRQTSKSAPCGIGHSQIVAH